MYARESFKRMVLSMLRIDTNGVENSIMNM